MRLILTTEAQFTEIWNKLAPNSRSHTTFPGANIYIQSIDALIVVDSDTTVVELTHFVDPISINLIHGKCIEAEE